MHSSFSLIGLRGNQRLLTLINSDFGLICLILSVYLSICNHYISVILDDQSSRNRIYDEIIRMGIPREHNRCEVLELLVTF